MQTSTRLLPFLLLVAGLSLGAFALWGGDGHAGAMSDSGGMFQFLLGLVGLGLVCFGLWLWLRNDDRRRRRYRRHR